MADRASCLNFPTNQFISFQPTQYNSLYVCVCVWMWGRVHMRPKRTFKLPPPPPVPLAMAGSNTHNYMLLNKQQALASKIYFIARRWHWTRALAQYKLRTKSCAVYILHLSIQVVFSNFENHSFIEIRTLYYIRFAASNMTIVFTRKHSCAAPPTRVKAVYMCIKLFKTNMAHKHAIRSRFLTSSVIL